MSNFVKKNQNVENYFICKFSCILTDKGKEFYRWKTIEKNFKIRVYFCAAGKPRQKALV